MTPPSLLPEAEIRQILLSLPDWRLSENALERVYIGKSYLDSLEKLNRVAQLSEERDHHPDLRLEWKTLTIRYWTHTAQGVTALDVEMAQAVEVLLN